MLPDVRSYGKCVLTATVTASVPTGAVASVGSTSVPMGGYGIDIAACDTANSK